MIGGTSDQQSHVFCSENFGLVSSQFIVDLLDQVYFGHEIKDLSKNTYTYKHLSILFTLRLMN